MNATKKQGLRDRVIALCFDLLNGVEIDIKTYETTFKDIISFISNAGEIEINQGENRFTINTDNKNILRFDFIKKKNMYSYLESRRIIDLDTSKILKG